MSFPSDPTPAHAPAEASGPAGRGSGLIHLEALASGGLAGAGASSVPAAVAEPRLEKRAGQLLFVLALLLTLAGGLYGIAGPVTWGHHGYHVGNHGQNARNTLRHGVFIANFHTGQSPAPTSSYYLHHPVLFHQYSILPILILGDNAIAIRTVPLFFTLVMVVVVFLLGRRLWGTLGGGVGALVLALVPLVLCFNLLMHIEQPGLVWMLMGTGGVAIFLDTHTRKGSRGETRWLWLSLGGFVMGALTDWIPYLMAFQLFLVACALYLSRPDSDRPYAPPRIPLAYLPALCLIMISGAWLHTFLVLYFERLADMRHAYTHRAGGAFNQAFFDQAWTWVTYLYPKPMLLISLAWLLALPIKWAAGLVRSRDLLPALFGFSQIIYILAFPTAVAIHIYRYYTFAILLAFVFCDLVTLTVMGVRRWLPALLRGSPGAWARVRGWAPLFAAALWLMPLVAIEATRGLEVLRESRRVSGTVMFNLPYTPQRAENSFFASVNRATTPLHQVLFHSSMLQPRWEGFWHLDRDSRLSPGVVQSSPDKTRPAVLLVQEGGPGLRPEAFHDLVRKKSMTRWGRYWMVDLDRPDRRLRAYDFEPDKSTRLYKFFASEFYPPLRSVRNIGDEWRVLLAAGADVPDHTPLPTPPRNDVRKIVYYADASAVRGKSVEVQKALGMLGAVLTTPATGPISVNDDVELIGHRLSGKTLQLVLRARSTPGKPLSIAVQAVDSVGRKVNSAPVRFSGAPQVPFERWRPGHLYLHEQPLVLAPGRYQLWINLVPAVEGVVAPAALQPRGIPIPAQAGAAGRLAKLPPIKLPPGTRGNRVPLLRHPRKRLPTEGTSAEHPEPNSSPVGVLAGELRVP